MIGIIAVGVPLLISIFFLLYTNFLIERDLKEDLLEIRLHAVERRATVLSYFLSDRMDDLVNLKHSREIAVFLESKASGMSMDLVPIREMFVNLMKRKEINGAPIFSRLAYVASGGDFLIDTRTERPADATAHPFRRPRASEDIPGNISISPDGRYFIVFTAHEHKGTRRGHIVGWIRPRIIYDMVLLEEKTISSPKYFIFDGNNALLPDDCAYTLTPYTETIKSLPAGKHHEFDMQEKTGGTTRMIAYKVPIPGTTYSLIHLSPAEKIYGKLTGRDRIITSTLLVVALIAGVAFTVRSILLKTSVNELERRVRERTAELSSLNENLQKEISERREAMKALEKTELKYRSIFENAVEGIFQATPDGRFLSANPALARIHGYGSAGELMDEITDLGGQLYLDRSCREEFVHQMEERGVVYHFEAQTRRKDGMINWVSINARNVRDENGATLYYEGTLENISERKHLESQLLQSQKMEAVGTLAGGIAHDFNNLLTAIIGYASLLQLKMDKDSPAIAYADHILTSSHKAINLTRRLLAFGRKQAIALKPHRVDTLIEGIAKLLRRLLTEDIDLAIDCEDGSTVIMADKTQIDQVLMNLATNARDAMPRGGRLAIEVRRTSISREFTGIHGYGTPGEYVLICVADTGSGMDEETKKKVFEPFFTTKDEGKGTGLGLSIVYGIIKQHNGYINVESKPGSGTTFRMYFPVVQAQGTIEARRVPMSIKEGTETILVAEDNPEVRSFMSEVLGISGYTVLEAADGEMALQEFSRNREVVALVILDVVMPVRNGKEVCEEIQKIKPDMKILFVSGYTRDVVLFKGIQDETADFISKPILPDQLTHKVREMLDK